MHNCVSGFGLDEVWLFSVPTRSNVSFDLSCFVMISFICPNVYLHHLQKESSCEQQMLGRSRVRDVKCKVWWELLECLFKKQKTFMRELIKMCKKIWNTVQTINRLHRKSNNMCTGCLLHNSSVYLCMCVCVRAHFGLMTAARKPGVSHDASATSKSFFFHYFSNVSSCPL